MRMSGSKFTESSSGWSNEDLARCKLTGEKPSTQALGGGMGFYSTHVKNLRQVNVQGQRDLLR